MAEYHLPQGGFVLNVEGDYKNTLDMEGFSLMLKDPSYCYKFYWLEALVKLITEGYEETTFDAVIDEMIANAWYSVREFHIHLSGIQGGAVRDGLERAVNQLAQCSGLGARASKTEIKNAIKAHNAELKQAKEQLTNMVPYRALSGFFAQSERKAEWGSVRRLTAYIRQINETTVALPYTLGEGSRLKKELYFHPAWIQMICSNAVSILGWIQYEKVRWLQMNNPEVPGLVYKLAPPDEKSRKLGHVRALWSGIMQISPVEDVFTGSILEKSSYDVDHFIPWSFTMNDELWNLSPMDSSLNSSKSNHLPRWEPFFARFAENQYRMYSLMQNNAKIERLYQACMRDNLHSIWAGQELYRPGNEKREFICILEKNMRPVYDSARRQGYEVWGYGTDAFVVNKKS